MNDAEGKLVRLQRDTVPPIGWIQSEKLLNVIDRNQLRYLIDILSG